ncbi:hypothetical protein Q7C36_019360 [Tachysurus vachellii]|uniref:TNFR-Cys domain-containing protein n=1 Tax=Tachysurus vachellii TaxID=175792 RepID=A0AA88LW99_TACVA|nr:hypothetical protein Q7C36_019360 [Tachysurus vachellii]
MQLIQLRLCHVLLIITTLYTTEAVTPGCEAWKASNPGVCCIQCRPGNHLVTDCGPDHRTLCRPCGPNTYANHPMATYCQRCTQCIDPQVQVKPCNSSANTVCGCKPGFRCGNQQCTYCVDECTKGQEPTDERDCRKCPDGTFNDQIHSACKPWRESCPKGEKILARGNEFSDITCATEIEISSSASDDYSIYPVIGFFTGSCVLMTIIILLLWFTFRRTRNKIQSKGTKPTTPTQGELTIMMVEREEACSFHQPEQEQGGSSDSINTQDSETKLIV